VFSFLPREACWREQAWGSRTDVVVGS